MSCYSYGKKGEEELIELLTKQCNGKCTIIVATREQDMKEHWDFHIITKTKSYKIDAKAIKNINRGDKQKAEHYHFIETVNVRGEHGWAYGLATHFGFQTKDYWIIVEAEKLREYIRNNMIDERIESLRDKEGNPICYKKYQRKGNKDEMMVVPNTDLAQISCALINRILNK
jgi:hypothetical protein